MRSFKDIMLGKPLKNSQIHDEKLSRLWGLPVMASDAVSSIAYAGEEILLALIGAGMLALGAAPWIVVPIILLLLMLVLSYSQIIDKYPQGGGAYMVSKDNLGRTPSLLAAAALIVDYIMTVAVSISSSTAAIVSAFPDLGRWRVYISVIFLLLLTFANLRGLRESARVFGTPTYIFIFSIGIMILVGFFRLITGTLHPLHYDAAVVQEMIRQQGGPMQGLGIVLILKAFSSGCTALTGVEAVSDAVPSFTEPSQKHAKQILLLLAGVNIFIFGGTSALTMVLHVMPLPESAHMTVIAQVAHTVFGGSFFFYFVQVVTALILLLAANTAYNGLPVLLSILSHDGFVPQQFSHRGSKLSFSNGILFICIVSGLLIIQFRSDTHRLIPLYAVGVFISFTLSQYGMFVRWVKNKEKGWKSRCAINGTGAIMTAACTVIVFSEKFLDGAWMLAIAIPIIILLMYYVKRHYEAVGHELKLNQLYPYYRTEVAQSTHCIILVHSISKAMLKSLNYANTISSDITCLHICRHPEHARELREQWDRLKIPVRLEIVLTQYRDIIRPLNSYISARERMLDHGENLSVIITKFISQHWYDSILHSQTAYFIERILSQHKNVSTILIPFYYSKAPQKDAPGGDEEALQGQEDG